MHANFLRVLSGLLVICMLCACMVPAVFAEAEQEPVITHVPTYENTHVNTGNQMLDIFFGIQTNGLAKRYSHRRIYLFIILTIVLGISNIWI